MSGDKKDAEYNVLQRLWNPAGSKKKGDNGKASTAPATLRSPKLFPLKKGQAAAADPSHTGIRKYVNDNSLRLEFFSVASNESAKFIPMDVKYSEQFSSEWNHVSVYGRNDPLSTFQGTKRTIKLSFVVNANSPADARSNMIEISNLASLLYPTYFEDVIGVKSRTKASKISRIGNATTIEASPLLRVHLSNLILDPSAAGTKGSGINAPARSVGLVCSSSGFDIEPDFDKGVFVTPTEVQKQATQTNAAKVGWESAGGDQAGAPKGSRVYPKSFNISTTLTVFHTFPMGYRREPGNKNTNSYARSDNGFGSFPWGEKHVYSQKERNTQRRTARSRRNDGKPKV